MNDREALFAVGVAGVVCLLGVLAIPVVLFGTLFDDGIVLVLAVAIIGTGLIIATRGTGRAGGDADDN